MPCDSVRTIGVELGRVNFDMLKPALEAAGWTVVITGLQFVATRNGETLVVRKDQASAVVRGAYVDSARAAKLTAEIKRTYAAHVVVEGARRYGWRLQSKTDQKDTTHLKMRR